MKKPKQYPCGCYWIRGRKHGDILHQCKDHEEGTGFPYDGSAPMGEKELMDFAEGLAKHLKRNVVVFHPVKKDCK